jgi:AraC-like DNA-binding protein
MLCDLRPNQDYLHAMTSAVRPARHVNGVPVYEYSPATHQDPVVVIRSLPDNVLQKSRHIHDFPLLTYVAESSSVYVVAAGEPIDPVWIRNTPDVAVVFFDAAALGDSTRSPWPSWRGHPLLFPFLHGDAGGILHLQLPPDRKPFWDNTIDSMDAELTVRGEGYRQAVLAHLTLLLIDLARMTGDVVADLRRSGEPLIADVFAVIERRIGEPLSLSDVAAELGLTPGHLTTVVRRRTGRTVQEWIIERRMTEARALLAGTDLPVAEIARRVGVGDPGYFARLFHRRHGVPPRRWRGGTSAN